MGGPLRDLLDAAVGEPPHGVSVEAVRRRVVRRRVMEGIAATVAAVAVIAVAVPVVAGSLGGSPAAQRPGVQQAHGPVAYVVSDSTGSVTPIGTATNTPAGKPIMIGNFPGAVAITPDGKTVYVTRGSLFTGGSRPGWVTPISTATGMLGKPIPVGGGPMAIAITPDGKTAYVANYLSGTVTPIATATNTAGKPITVGNHPMAIAIG